MEDDSKGKSIGLSESKSSLDKPPFRVRALVLEHRDKYLSTVETMLVSFGYIVSKCQQAKDALSLLVENKSSYDIVISDTHLPGMEGFKLLEKVGSEMDLPVVLILYEKQRDSILEGIFHSDRGHLIKPITCESLGQIKEQILLKKENRELGIRVLLVRDDDQLRNQTANKNVLLSHHDQDQYSPAAINEADHANNKSATLKRVKDEENHDQELHDDRALSCDATETKKPRLVWSTELHHKFITAVEQLGFKNAVPKKILESMQNMGVSSLTRENVASHLQKYRMNVKKTTNQCQTKSLLGLPKMHVGQNYALDGKYKLIQSSAGPDQLHFSRITLSPNFDHVATLPNQIRHINSRLDSSFDHVAVFPDQMRHINSRLDSSFDHVVVSPDQMRHINSHLDSSFDHVAIPPDQIRHINSCLYSSSGQAMGPDHHKMTQQFVDHNIDSTAPSYNSAIPVRQASNLQRSETPDQFFWNINNDQYCQQNEIAPSRQIMDESGIHFQPFGYDVCEKVVANATNSMNINNTGAMPQHLATSRQYDDFSPLNMTNSGHPTINSSPNYGNNSFIDNQLVDHVAGEEYVNLGNNDIGPYYNEPVDENAYYHHTLVQPEQRFDGDIFMQKPFTLQSGSGLAKTKRSNYGSFQ